MFGPNDVHVMVDIETAGTNPGDIILQVGAVAFVLGDNTEILDGKNEYFKIGISVEDSEACGFTTDSNTLTWWTEQDTDLRHKVWSGQSTVSQFLYEFADYLAQFGDKDNIYIWANDPDFDCTLIKAYYVQLGFGSELPWDFRNNRSFRTVKALYPERYAAAKDKIINNTKHDALADAVWQTQIIREVLRSRDCSQAEIAKRDARIELLNEELKLARQGAEHSYQQAKDYVLDAGIQNAAAHELAKQNTEQAAEISRLKGVIAKAGLLLEPYDYGQFADDFDQPLAKSIRKTIRELCEAIVLAAIKEEGL